MRLKRLKCQGFRAFATEQEIDLDAPAIVIVGANGQGKTSICDAILWGMAGDIPRLSQGSDESKSKATSVEPLSLYAETGEVRVLLTFDDNGEEVRLLRTSVGNEQDLRFECADEVWQGPEAEIKFYGRIGQRPTLGDRGRQKLARTLSQSVYLQQDLIRRFVDGQSDRDRFEAMSDLLGVGEITDLLERLDGARRPWSKRTNELETSLGEQQARAERIEAELREIDAAQELLNQAAVPQEREWSEWWATTREQGVFLDYIPGYGSSKTRDFLDRGIRDLQARRRQIERSLHLGGELAELLGQSPPAPEVGLDELRETQAAARARVETARVGLEEARSTAAEERRKLTEQEEREAGLRALARIALRHLEDHCPVCQQEYDVEGTRHRLEALSAEGVADDAPRPSEDAVTERARALEAAERELADVTARIEAEESRLREERSRTESRARTLAELGVESGGTEEETAGNLRAFVDRCKLDVETMQAHEKSGEALMSRLAAMAQVARREELNTSLQALRRESSVVEEDLSSRRETTRAANDLVEGLRDAALEAVRVELRRVEPILRRIWLATDPHPSLRDVSFHTEITYNKGRLRTRLRDPEQDKQTERPEAVLSSSQVNALAVTAFLATNLGLRDLPLDAIVLDDPLQSLDDVNLLGVVDLLRRIKGRRQLIVCTHDEAFGKLLARKLRPRPGAVDQRTIKVTLQGWGRRGPRVECEEVRSNEPLRLVASAAG